MIELGSTWSEVVMLLVAGGVGMIGGVGAALLEWNISAVSPTAAAKPKGGGAVFLSVFAAIFLGGAAAVAIIYFFTPVKEVENSSQETVRFYELLRLVPLSLLVGTAGTAFLQSMQTRALSTLNAARAETTEVTAKAEVGGVGAEATKAAQSGIEESKQLEQTLLDHGVAASATGEVLNKIATQAASAVESEMAPRVEAARRTIAAAAALPGADPPV